MCSCRTVELRKNFCWQTGEQTFFRRATVLQLTCVLSLNWLKLAYFIYVFSLFRYYLPLEKGVALHLKKPFTQDTLCKVCLKLAQWFWRSFINAFSLFRYYFPLEDGVVLHLNKLYPLHPSTVNTALCKISFNGLELWRRFLKFHLFVIISP